MHFKKARKKVEQDDREIIKAWYEILPINQEKNSNLDTFRNKIFLWHFRCQWIQAMPYSWDKEVQSLKALQKEFRTALLDYDFLGDNRKLILEGTQTDVDATIEKFRNKL